MLAGLDDTSVVCMVHSGADVFLLACEVINFSISLPHLDMVCLAGSP